MLVGKRIKHSSSWGRSQGGVGGGKWDEGQNEKVERGVEERKYEKQKQVISSRPLERKRGERLSEGDDQFSYFRYGRSNRQVSFKRKKFKRREKQSRNWKGGCACEREGSSWRL